MSRPRRPQPARFTDPSYTSHRLVTDDCGEPRTSQPRRLAFSVVGSGSSLTYHAPRGQVEMLRDQLTEWLDATEPHSYVVVPANEHQLWHVHTNDDNRLILAVIEEGKLRIPVAHYGRNAEALKELGDEVVGEAIDALRDAYAEENSR